MTEHKESSVLARFASPLLILATIIWGSSFVVMKSSVDVLPTFWLLAIRFSFAALVLAVVFIRRWKVLDKQYLIGGTVMGFCLFLAYTFQTFGLEQTTSGKNAFFTAVYCVIVPFLYWFIAKRRPDRFNLIAAFLCIGGIALVSITGDNASAFNGRCAHPHRRLLLRRPHRGRVQVLRGTGHLHPHHPPVCLLRPLFLAGGTDHPPGADARGI